jgi:arginyl-tRNA synthetase
MIYDYRDNYREKIVCALKKLLTDAGADAGKLSCNDIIFEIPPNPGMGDIGFPLFSFAKILRKGPPQIAALLHGILTSDSNSDEFEVQGSYLNIRLNRSRAAHDILSLIFKSIDTNGNFTFGRPGTLAEKKIMVEFSSPNTNKPLHLGHLRNDVLGESISRLLAACGAELRKVCIINDRGIHICKSMLAYLMHGMGKTPESENIKSDHFVGKWYVDFNKMLKADIETLMHDKGLKQEEAETRSPSMAGAQELLRKWEAGDHDTISLWKRMNSWAVDGIKKTYLRTGISFDQYYFESNTYLLGRDEVIKGLEQGIFHREPDGAVAVELEGENLGKKILLRSDGTSIYITQDFGTAISRYHDWPFDQHIYVVGSEQQYHFRVLFALLGRLGYPWAKDLYHLSYGMVNLPEGKMKSREGTVVDADDLLDSLRDMALAEIHEKEREANVGNPAEVAEKIALGALHYYLLQINPVKDMLFDPKESLSFNGNTGPYLQYMGARISSMLRKHNEQCDVSNEQTSSEMNFSLLVSDSEWELIKILAVYPQAVNDAAAALDPSRLTAYLYELSKAFCRFYHDCPVLNAANQELSSARLGLSRAVMLVLKDALQLACIPFLEIM